MINKETKHRRIPDMHMKQNYPEAEAVFAPQVAARGHPDFCETPAVGREGGSSLELTRAWAVCAVGLQRDSGEGE